VLVIVFGQDIDIETFGADDAQEALNALVELVNNKFNEEH